MRELTQKEKTIIGISGLIISILVFQKYFVAGLTGIIFTAIYAIENIVKIYYPKFNWFRQEINYSPEIKEERRKEFLKIYNDSGIFTYNENGFSILTENKAENVNWQSIKTLVGFKEDLYAVDRICLWIYLENEMIIKINEETKGWFQFLENSKTKLDIKDKMWEMTISNPAFEQNTTIIFDKENRTLEEINNVK